MQTLQFTHALHRIVVELKAQQLFDFTTQILAKKGQNAAVAEGEKQTFSTLLFESRVGFAEMSKDEDADRILKALNVGEIYSPPRLGKILANFSNMANFQGLTQSDVFAEFFKLHDMVGWLLTLEKACSQLLETEKLGEVKPEQMVEVELIDYDGTGVEIERVRQLFASLADLNVHIARILGITDAPLKVLVLDSGSNLLVGVATTATISKTIKELFLELWEKIKYRRFEEFDRKVESLTKGLTLAATIQEQIEKKVINEETGKNLQYRILDEMTTLIGIGAMLPAQEISEKVDRKRLLAEKKGIKLLGSGEQASTDSK